MNMPYGLHPCEYVTTKTSIESQTFWEHHFLERMAIHNGQVEYQENLGMEFIVIFTPEAHGTAVGGKS